MKLNTKNFFIIIIFFINFVTFAQGDESDGNDLEGNDPAPTPINSKLIYLVILGLLYIFYYLKNKKQYKNL